MKPLQVIYILRLTFGLVAALLGTGYTIAVGNVSATQQRILLDEPIPIEWSIFFNGMTLAIIVYILSYYAIKRFFALKVEKPQKIFTMGIGIYFLSWIVFWVLTYTIIVNL